MEELGKILELTEDESGWDRTGGSTLPLLISDAIIPLLSVPAIRRQFVPSAKENQDTIGSLDPQEEAAHRGTDRLIHRYSSRAAFYTTDSCFAYCRHCFRRRFAGHLAGPASVEEIKAAAAYIASHPEIKEVLLTGGDLFTLSDSRIDAMLSIFKESCPSTIFRLCTSMGIPAFNQSVLLKGVNDDAAVLKELSEKLLMARVKPYYLFQDDPVRGTAHFRVDIEDGLAIEKELRSELSGLAMPQYTADLPAGGGKVILTHGYYMGSEDEGGRKRYAFETPDGGIRHYPE